MRFSKWVPSIVLLAMIQFFIVSQCFAQKNDFLTCAEAPTDVQKAERSQVTILVIRESKGGVYEVDEGTGVVVAPQYVLTAFHVVAGEDRKQIDDPGMIVFVRIAYDIPITWRARVVAYSAQKELALLRVDWVGQCIKIVNVDFPASDITSAGNIFIYSGDNTPSWRDLFAVSPISLAASVKEGQRVWMGGFTFMGAINNVCYYGIVRSVEMSKNAVNWEFFNIDPIMVIQGSVEEGFSGSAVLDEKGEMVGSVFAKNNGGIAFASPLSSIKTFLSICMSRSETLCQGLGSYCNVK